MSTYIIVQCPHCKDYISVRTDEINCKIFRHGVFKDTFLQINPHSREDVCAQYVKEGKIYGCGKPYELVNDEGRWVAVECDYI